MARGPSRGWPTVWLFISAAIVVGGSGCDEPVSQPSPDGGSLARLEDAGMEASADAMPGDVGASDGGVTDAGTNAPLDAGVPSPPGVPFSLSFPGERTWHAEKHTSLSWGQHISFALTELQPSSDLREAVVVLTTTSDGESAWQRRYVPGDAEVSLDVGASLALDDGLLLSGSIERADSSGRRDTYLIRLGPGGDVVWARRLDNGAASAPQLFRLPDGFVLLVTRLFGTPTRTVYARMGLDGSLDSAWSLGSVVSPITNLVANPSRVEMALQDGNVVEIAGDFSAVLGQRKFEAAIGFNFSPASDGDYLYCSAQVAFPGHITVFRTDPEGVLRWAQTVEAWTGTSPREVFDVVGVHFVQEDAEGNVVCAADSEGGANGSIVVVLDAEGSLVDSRWVRSNRLVMTPISNEQFLSSGFVGTALARSPLLERRSFAEQMCDDSLSHEVSPGSDRRLTPDPMAWTPEPTLGVSSLSIVSAAVQIEAVPHCRLD